jgi:6-pyruvoyltetrahydropterin/6-carboxytetrahydropterin synthase
MSHEVIRYHDFSAGHRVVGHENKCKELHGHNYRVHFTCISAELDDIGRVIDFGVIKELLCEWLEENWDHKMLLWNLDPICGILREGFTWSSAVEALIKDSVVEVPFNPTAENMAEYLVEVIGPKVLKKTDVRLIRVTVDETRKCSATYTTQGMRGNIA